MPPSGGGSRAHLRPERARRWCGRRSCCRPRGGSRRRGRRSRAPTWRKNGWLLLPGSSGLGSGALANGSSTSLVHEESSRACSRNGHEAHVEVHEVGQLALQLARGAPGARAGPTRARAWRMNGSAASSVGPGGAHARQRVDRERAQRGQRGVQRRQRRRAGAQHVAQRRDRGLQRHVLARERARGDVEVGDEVLQRVLVLDQRGEGLLLALEQPLDVARGLEAERRLVHDRRVLERRLAVAQRLVEAPRALALEALRVLLEEDLEVRAGVRLKRREQVAELHRRGRSGSSGSDRRRPRAPARRASRARGPRRSCPRGRCAGGS